MLNLLLFLQFCEIHCKKITFFCYKNFEQDLEYLSGAFIFATCRHKNNPTTHEPNSDLFKFGFSRLHLDGVRIWGAILEVISKLVVQIAA